MENERRRDERHREGYYYWRPPTPPELLSAPDTSQRATEDGVDEDDEENGAGLFAERPLALGSAQETLSAREDSQAFHEKNQEDKLQRLGSPLLRNAGSPLQNPSGFDPGVVEVEAQPAAVGENKRVPNDGGAGAAASLQGKADPAAVATETAETSLRASIELDDELAELLQRRRSQIGFDGAGGSRRNSQNLSRLLDVTSEEGEPIDERLHAVLAAPGIAEAAAEAAAADSLLHSPLRRSRTGDYARKMSVSAHGGLSGCLQAIRRQRILSQVAMDEEDIKIEQARQRVRQLLEDAGVPVSDPAEPFDYDSAERRVRFSCSVSDNPSGASGRTKLERSSTQE